MKIFRVVFILLFACRLASAQTNTAPLDVNGLLNAAQNWAQENLDDDVLRALQDVNRAKVGGFLKQYQNYLQGDYVLDLAQLNTAATAVLPLLEAHEETQPYARGCGRGWIISTSPGSSPRWPRRAQTPCRRPIPRSSRSRKSG